MDGQKAPTKPSIDSTWFTVRFDEWLRKHRLPDPRRDPTARVSMTAVEFRKASLEFFSWGCVHQAIAQQRLEELLPVHPPAAAADSNDALRLFPPRRRSR